MSLYGLELVFREWMANIFHGNPHYLYLAKTMFRLHRRAVKQNPILF